MSRPDRIIIVGGGIAGLACAARLAQSGLPVTLLEASQLGVQASARNQGWLHSGAWFAAEDSRLARLCYDALRRTIDFAPEVLEPTRGTMLFLFSKVDAPPYGWLKAWTEAGIPFETVTREQALPELPGVDPNRVQHIYRLPDRAFDPQRLMERLAAEARNAGAEIRPETSVSDLIRNADQVLGVKTSRGEEILARQVVLTTGARSGSFWRRSEFPVPQQGEVESRVLLKTHLISVRPGIDTSPFCVPDDAGFNHLPHRGTSVFGSARWNVTHRNDDREVQPSEVASLWGLIERFVPAVHREQCSDVQEWAGTTLQLMQVDQIEPGLAPFPVVINHELLSLGEKNLWTVCPGRASLWIEAAEELRRQLLENLDRPPAPVTSAPWAAR